MLSTHNYIATSRTNFSHSPFFLKHKALHNLYFLVISIYVVGSSHNKVSGFGDVFERSCKLHMEFVIIYNLLSDF